MHLDAIYEKPVKRLYISYLLPTLIAMASSSLYCLVDVYFIAKGAGSIGLAAVNIAMPMFTIFSAIGLTFGVGAATVMAIAEGSKHQGLRDQAFTLSLVIMLILGIVLSLCSTLFVDQFAYALGSSDALLPYVREYMLPINLSSFAFVLMYASSILIRADHAPKLAMKSMLFGNIANIVLDYVFVIVFQMGLFGAAFATAISPFLTLIGVAFHFILKKNTVHLIKDFYDPRLLKRMIGNGLGSGILEVSSGVIILIFNIVILHFADAMFLAAYAIVCNIAFVCKGLLTGFAQASQPIISVNHGAGKKERVKEAFYVSLRYSILFSSFVYIIFLMFPEFVASIFANGDQTLIDTAAQGIRLYFSSLVFSAAITMIMYYLQSVEYGRASTFLAVSKGFLFIVVGLLVLISLLGMNGIWLSITFAEGFACLVGVYFLKRKEGSIS